MAKGVLKYNKHNTKISRKVYDTMSLKKMYLYLFFSIPIRLKSLAINIFTLRDQIFSKKKKSILMFMSAFIFIINYYYFK